MASCFVYNKSKLKQTTSNESLVVECNTQEEEIVMRVAMLGLSQTGKTTIVKGMKMLFKDTYDKQADRMNHRIVISRNILSILKVMIRKMQKKLVRMSEPVQISAAKLLMYHMESDTIPMSLAEGMVLIICLIFVLK
jgi:hypothetical protein